MELDYSEDHELLDAFVEQLHSVAQFELLYEHAGKLSPFFFAFVVGVVRTRKMLLQSFSCWFRQTLAEFVYVSTNCLYNAFVSEGNCLVE